MGSVQPKVRPRPAAAVCRGRPLQEFLDRARERGWPLVMGVINITPDSFSDGGRFLSPERALDHALRLAAEGADVLDLGGASTRPGAADVTLDEELQRVIPVIESIRRRSPVPLSIDTSKPGVMHAAIEAGADIINDVRALREPGALACAAQLGATVVLMHMRGEPRTMQNHPRYTDVVAQVGDFLRQRVAACVAAGLERGQLILDPGFGFGKNLQHNLTLLANLGSMTTIGLPVLVGVSRKSMIGAILERDVNERVHGSVALAVYAAQHGAAILRVHDVQATCDALRVTARVAACVDRTETVN